MHADKYFNLLKYNLRFKLLKLLNSYFNADEISTFQMKDYVLLALCIEDEPNSKLFIFINLLKYNLRFKILKLLNL